jgi:hypothetical protein
MSYSRRSRQFFNDLAMISTRKSDLVAGRKIGPSPRA